MSIRFLTLSAAVAALGLASNAGAAAIVSFNTFGNAGTETTEPSTTIASGIQATQITLGAGITAAANGNRFGGNNWFDTGNTAAGNTLAEAIAGNNYLEFIVTPTAGTTYTVTDFTFIFDASGTGPKSVTLRSSVDSFAADLGSATVTSGNTTVFSPIDFPDLVNRTTATTFRLYGTGATATAGTGGFDTGSSQDNVVLNGTAVPEPASLGLVGLAGLLAVRRRPRRAV